MVKKSPIVLASMLGVFSIFALSTSVFADEVCTDGRWLDTPTEIGYCEVFKARVESQDPDDIDMDSIQVFLDGESVEKCTVDNLEDCYQTNVDEDGDTRIFFNINNGTCLSLGTHTIRFVWNDGGGYSGETCDQGVSFEIIEATSLPSTGLLDTVNGRVSLGLGFIVLGGLVSQYSRFNTFYNGVIERSKFKSEVRKSSRVKKNRDSLESKFE